MKNVKRLIVTFLAGALVFSFTACSTQNNAQTGDSTDNINLTISAAASLKNAMEELTPMYEEASKGQTLTFNYGGSGDLQIALGEPSAVPAGQYAEEALTSLNLLDSVKAKAVYGKDVTQVLTYVENGEVDAGLVYETDAKSVPDKVTIVSKVPESSYRTVVYPMAVLKGSTQQDAAKNFESFLKSDEAKAVFKKYGFESL
ncbi:molybdate ABC transporter substrate-binding protein [Eubacterium callanderi]|uniref:molybdate ABC transporter substrate-binding protein n=1 Tax=Eubacterium callanderi TaxID=53442 RepID=UPI002671819F|nr:molybdate ABC transporter substrate-binding protein [Eubacterium callanderi]